MAEVLTAELCTDSCLLGKLQHFLLKFNIAKRVAKCTTSRGERVEVTSAGELCSFHCNFCRGATNNNSKVIRRASCRAESFHFVEQPRQKCLFIQQCFGFLEEVALVCRAATLCHEEKLVCIAIDSRNFDFSGKVVASVDFVIHVERSHLAVTQVAGEIRVVDTACNCFFIAAACEYELALLAFHDCRTGVLAHGQNSTS